MFKVYINDGIGDLPKDDICYIIAKEGVFLKKKVGIMDSIAPVNTISILKSITPIAQMHIPKIPALMFAKIVDFFNQVYTKYQSEAIVLIFYNEKTKKYKIIPPTQTVSMTSIEYKRSISIKDFTMIGDIHSHASFSAFHSSTDTSDEKTFDGLHITIGNVNSRTVSISSSIVSNGYRFITDPLIYIDGIKETTDISDELDEKISKKASCIQQLDKRYVLTVPISNKCQASKTWLEKVKHEKIVYPENYENFWGENYSVDIWNQYQKLNSKVLDNNVKVLKRPKSPFLNLHISQIPCFSCIYRDEKILLDQEDLDEFYICDKCKMIIRNDLVNLVCPVCKTDKYLKFFDENLKNNFQMDKDLLKTKNKKKHLTCLSVNKSSKSRFTCSKISSSDTKNDDSQNSLNEENYNANKVAIDEIKKRKTSLKKDTIMVNSKNKKIVWKKLLKKALRGDI